METIYFGCPFQIQFPKLLSGFAWSSVLETLRKGMNVAQTTEAEYIKANSFVG